MRSADGEGVGGGNVEAVMDYGWSVRRRWGTVIGGGLYRTTVLVCPKSLKCAVVFGVIVLLHCI